MSKSIPAPLLAHFGDVTGSKADLIKVVPKFAATFGIASIDRDVTFDDGGGALIYRAATGLDIASIQTSGDASVGNTEATVLLFDTGEITDANIQAGELDHADYYLYRINWKDPAAGFELRSAGKLGRVGTADNLTAVLELRELPQLLRQNFIDLYSVTCRAVFGSKSGKFPCTFDADSLWTNGQVAAVDANEPNRVFTAVDVPAVNGPAGPLTFVPGLVQFTSGQNNGLTVAIEEQSGTSISLFFGAAWPIAVNDTFRIRPDCDKRWETCRDVYLNIPFFRGEPKTPLAAEAANMMPGARVPNSASTIDFPEEPGP